MNKVPKVIFLYDTRLPYEIGIFRYIEEATFSLKQRVAYKICVVEERNKYNIEYVREYGNRIPSSIGSALFRCFKDGIEDVYQDPRIVSL